jgi:hypothetical protein
MVKIFYAIAAVVPGCCTVDGTPDGTFLGGGTGTVAVTDRGTTLSADLFDTTWVTYGSGTIDFRFGFGDGTGAVWAELACSGVAWSTAETATAPIPLATACAGAAPQLSLTATAADQMGCTASVAFAHGTLSVTTRVDDNHNGTVTLQLDIPTTAVTASDPCNGSHTLAVTASALAGVMRFAPTSCGGGGINPAI